MSESEHALRRRDAARSLGLALRVLRQGKGLSQEQVANAARVSVYAYGCLERGRAPSGGIANPTMDTLLRVFTALDIEPPHLPKDGSAARISDRG